MLEHFKIILAVKYNLSFILAVLFFIAPGNSYEYEEKIRNLQEMGFDEVKLCTRGNFEEITAV